jgi:hypothetical protein
MDRMLVALLVVLAFDAFAQAPVSGLRGNAPPVRSSVAPAQQLVVPADFERLDDHAIIIIGGKPITAGEAKRIVHSLDDAAIIIIGGKPTAAGDVKRQLDAARAQQKVDSRVASPSTLSPWPAPAAGTKALSTPASRNSFGIHEVDPGLVHQNEKFVIRGISLGDKAGTVELDWYNPYLSAAVPITVTTTRWTSTRIDATAPALLPWFDPSSHSLGLVVTTANGERYTSAINVYYLQSKGSP